MPTSNKGVGHCEILWDIMRHYETLWDIMRHYKSCYDIMRHNGPLWDSMRQYETCCDIMRRNGPLWNTMRQYRTFRDIMRHDETLWDIMKHHKPPFLMWIVFSHIHFNYIMVWNRDISLNLTANANRHVQLFSIGWIGCTEVPPKCSH